MNVLIVNPVAGKGAAGREEKQIFGALSAFVPDIVSFRTDSMGDAMRYVRKNGSNIKRLFVAGGDGTLNEIINGMDLPSQIQLVPIPAGSGNDFCRAMTGGNKFDKSFRFLENPIKLIKCDLGHVLIVDSTGRIIERRFHSSLGAGFDAHVSKLSNRKSFLRGIPLYLSSVLMSLKSFRSIECSIMVNNREIQGKKLLVTICNTSTVGGGFRLTPRALIADGLLDLMTADEMPPHEILSVLPKAIIGRHLTDNRVQYEQFKKLEVTFKEPVIIHSDGDILTEKGMSMSVRIFESAVEVIALKQNQ